MVVSVLPHYTNAEQKSDGKVTVIRPPLANL